MTDFFSEKRILFTAFFCCCFFSLKLWFTVLIKKECCWRNPKKRDKIRFVKGKEVCVCESSWPGLGCVYTWLYSSVPVGGCLLLCFSVKLRFCYFRLETGCDSDCMVDCVIEWTNHTHSHTHTCHTFLLRPKNTWGSLVKWCVALNAHTLRVSGNGAGFPQSKPLCEADDRAASAVDRRALLGFIIGLKHQLLIRLRSEKRIKRTQSSVETEGRLDERGGERCKCSWNLQ